MESENIQLDKHRIAQLELGLEDMTSALTHAWDQLVPFLHGVPEQAASNDDMTPVIQGAMEAVHGCKAERGHKLDSRGMTDSNHPWSCPVF